MSKFTKMFNKAKKVELPPSDRKVAEVQQDYTNVCAQLGNVEYQLWILYQEAEALKEKCKSLNQEGAAAKAREDAAQLAEVEAPNV